MLVGIMGKMGSGKTLSRSILGVALSRIMNQTLYANYTLQESQRILSVEDLWKADSGIFCFDEAWFTLDSRRSGRRDNVDLTKWVNQTRKKKLLVLYTTQHIGQMDLRVREGTDILIYVKKFRNMMKLQFIDYQYLELGRTYTISNPKAFFNLYNTYEVVSPLTG